jgi:hypothetical protein
MNLRSFVKLGLMLIAASALWLSAWASLTRGADNATLSKADPILADLKITSELEWMPDGPGEQPPALQVDILLRGTAVKHASGMPDLRLDAIVDENGKSYRRRCDQTSSWHRQPDAPGTRRSTFRIGNRPAIQTIRELRGSVMLQTAAERQEIVLQNAFKTLGKPIKDKTLAALGIQVVIKVSPTADWDPQSKYREHVSIVAKCDRDPKATDRVCKVVGVSVSDEEGPIPGREQYLEEGRASKTFCFGCDVKIPPEAELRLVVHKGCRDVRVPFVLTNIPVPKVPASLDKPAIAGEDSVEAEVVSLDDPIVAGLKTNVETTTERVIALRLEGKPVEQASHFGDVDLDGAFDETGHSVYLENCATRMFGRPGDPDFRENCVAAYFWLADEPLPKRLRELRGSVALRTGGRLDTVIVKDVLENVGKPIENETLKALGISVRVARHERHLDSGELTDLGPNFKDMIEAVRLVFVQDGKTFIHHFDVLDGRGSPVQTGENYVYDKNGTVEWNCYYKKELPLDTQLRIVVHKDSRKVRVPFVFKDIKIPPAAKEQE